MLLWKSQTRIIWIPSAFFGEDNKAYTPYKVGGKLMEVQHIE